MEDYRADPVETHPDQTHPAGDQGVRAGRLEACRKSYADRIAAQAGIATGSEIAAALAALPVVRAEAGHPEPGFLGGSA